MKIATYFLFVLLFVLFVLGNGRVLAEDIKLIPVAYGINLHLKQATSGSEYAIISVARNANADIKVVIPKAVINADEDIVGESPERQRRGLLLSDYKKETNALAVISSGYLASYSPPVATGYLKIDGLVRNYFQDSWINSGIFCSNGYIHRIIPIINSSETATFKDCIQAGPLIIENGERGDIDSSINQGYDFDSYRDYQSFICIDGKDGLAFGVTNNMTLSEIISIIKEKPYECKWAMRLTGAVTAGMIIDKTIHGHNKALLPTAIAVFPSPTVSAPSGLRLVR